jgi:hypothetical protein
MDATAFRLYSFESIFLPWPGLASCFADLLSIKTPAILNRNNVHVSLLECSMKIDVFDTYITTQAGKRLHFDVFVPPENRERAREFALTWLAGIGIQTEDIQQESCRYCHSEPAEGEIAQAIATQGYFIYQMEGCPQPVSP